MLGWTYNIWRQIDPPTTPEREQGGFVCGWSCGLSGISWISDLAKIGLAQFQGGNGYPLFYVMKASTFRCQLTENPLCLPNAEGVPGAIAIGDDYSLPLDWRGVIDLQKYELDACQDDELLAIEVWDLS